MLIKLTKDQGDFIKQNFAKIDKDELVFFQPLAYVQIDEEELTFSVIPITLLPKETILSILEIILNSNHP